MKMNVAVTPVIRVAVVLVFCGALLSCAAFAYAETAVARFAPQVSIGANGQTMVRDAKVEYISGNSIIVTTTWGEMSLRWTVITDGSTKFYPDGGSRETLSAIRPGDPLSFTGFLDKSDSRQIVKATVVRDTALFQESAVVTGRVLHVSSHDKVLTMAGEHGTTTVLISEGTVITRDGNPVQLDMVATGTLIRAYGSLNLTTSTLGADKIAFTGSAEIVAPGSDVSVADNPGFFDALMRWLRGTERAISFR
ncbi:hypothetical protein K8R03_05050 [Candidatus Kaiserbacteria bacterium]|nr:hypothetical protein [Candidatus Kaiserbacteria bacterium]